MPRSLDLVMFVWTDDNDDRQTDTTNYFIPCCAYACTVMKACQHTSSLGFIPGPLLEVSNINIVTPPPQG